MKFNVSVTNTRNILVNNIKLFIKKNIYLHFHIIMIFFMINLEIQ